MNRRILLIAALALPILALGVDAFMHHLQRASGEAVTLPIEGFDPRDLLSGHYLQYQVDYGVENGCDGYIGSASVCLRPTRGIYPRGDLPADCGLFIQGHCDDHGIFLANIERFYIPEEYAQSLEDKVRDHQGELALSVDRQGNAAIRDLLIDGKPWKEVAQTSH